MTDAHDAKSRHDAYRRTRDAFDQMKTDDQATFLVQATASLVARGVEEIGRMVAGGLDDLFEGRAAPSSSQSGSKHGPGPAQPETAQQRRPRSGRPGTSDQ